MHLKVVLNSIKFLDDYMCDFGEVSTASEACKSLCFHTAKVIYEIKTNVKDVMLEFIEAYTALNENMKIYKKQWETLGHDFFQ